MWEPSGSPDLEPTGFETMKASSRGGTELEMTYPTAVVGNLTQDPELRYTAGGVPVANVTIASTERVFDRQTNEWKDGPTTFLRGSVWREIAEHAAASLAKGQQVLAIGKLRQNDYQDREGNPRTSYELEILEIGPSLRFGTTTFTRAAKSAGQAPQQAPAAQMAQAASVNQPAAAAPVAQAQAAPAGVAAAQALSDDAF